MNEQIDDISELTQVLNKISRDYRIAMTEFSDAAKRREQFSLRAEQRTNRWLYASVGGVFLLFISLVAVMFFMMQHAQNMTTQIQILSQQFDSATQKLEVMQSQPVEIKHTYPDSVLSQPAIEFPDISPALKSIETELFNLNDHMALVTAELYSSTVEASNQSNTKDTTAQSSKTEAKYVYPYSFPHRY